MVFLVDLFLPGELGGEPGAFFAGALLEPVGLGLYPGPSDDGWRGVYSRAVALALAGR
jgi:hypothetical protein